MLQASPPCQEKLPKGEKLKQKFSFWLLICVLLPLHFLTGCANRARTEAGAQPSPPGLEGRGSTAVDVAIAQTGLLQEPLEYTGTTRPVREVSLRSQTEGRLLSLNADVGDAVKQGQILAQLDDSLLLTAVSEAQAELAARISEVARAQTQVNNAQARAEQARLELQQAQTNAARLQTLATAGAISEQEAEIAQTAAATAQQNLRSTITQIRTEQQAVASAKERVAAQKAVVAQNRERQSYALITSPMTGVVLERVTEPGNLVMPGSEILKLGDFSFVKVIIPVSELDLSTLSVGQSVTVRLDAFAKQFVSGKVTRISPAADPVMRQVQVEVTIPNSNGKIGSGLLARVSFAPRTPLRVIVPQTALQAVALEQERRGDGEQSQTQNPKSSEATLFVVTDNGDDGTEAKVHVRSVQVGDLANNQVEILSGLRPGERFVAQSSKPLKDGQTVRLSILSE